MSLESLPVVLPSEMKKAEVAAFSAGESELKYMENAGLLVARVVEDFLITPRSSEHVYLLIGKGNNGGDAFAAGEILHKKGYSVVAFCLFSLEQCSPLAQKMAHRFKSAGGKAIHVTQPPDFEGEGVILDGLFGTGFQGKAEGLVKALIDGANHSGLAIFSIDIPSGLNGSTGEVASSAIKADQTIFLGLPKMGFFLKDGWNYVGKLVPADFGMPKKFVKQVKKEGYLVSKSDVAKKLPPIERTRHKYESGYVLAVAGSPGMPGAALMATLAALKTGSGIVRLFYPHEMKEELSAAAYELIKEGWDLKDDHRIFEEEKRAKSLIVGPGCGREPKMRKAIEKILSHTVLPCVVDADALYFLSQNKEMALPRQVILTPHHQEMKRLIDAEPDLISCQEFVDEKKVTLVLKGAPTLIFHPQTKPLIVAHGDPGMATAGTGDVLTGIIAAFLAQGLEPRDAAGVAVFLHALSGEIAADHETSYGMIATDLIHFLPEAFEALIKSKTIKDDQ